MASILERTTKEGTSYTANVRKKGIRLARTFDSRKKAERWGSAVELAIDEATDARPFDRSAWLEERTAVPVAPAAAPAQAAAPALPTDQDGEPDEEVAPMAAEDHHPKPHPGWSLRHAMRHYLDTVTPSKRGWKAETDRLIAWTTAEDRLAIAEERIQASRHGGGEPDPRAVIEFVFVKHRHDAGSVRLDQLRAEHIQPFVTARHRAGKASTTIRNEVFLVTAVYNHAAEKPYADGSGGWGLDISSNLDRIKLPDAPDHRDRRLHVGEWEKLQKAFDLGPDAQEMKALTTILLETACRLSEPLGITWTEVEHLSEGVSLRLRKTKNGRPRRVYLSSRARAALDLLKREPKKPLFSIDRPDVEYRWRIACERAGITDLHMHDLRHEGLSRMAAKGMPLQHLMSQSGHRDARTLSRYLNTSPAEIVRMLD